MRRISTIGMMAAALSLAGCGGGAATQEEEEPLAMSGGAEDPQPEPEPDDVEPDPEPQPEPTGPGQLTVHVRVSGQDVAGTVQVLDGDGEVVAEGASGDTFNLESGSYRVLGAVTDAAVMIDRPTRELDGMATVPAGGTAEVRVDIPVARVRLNVTRGGRPVGRWRATLTRQGMGQNPEITMEPSESHVAISPGRYDAIVRFGTQEITVNGLIFQGGATQTVPVNVN